jgi:hypothetical protein
MNNLGFQRIAFIYSNIFRGAVAGSNTQEATDRLSVLKDEIGRLDEYEKLIDQHKTVSQQFSIS